MERYVRSRYRSFSQSIDEDYEPEEAAQIKEEIKRTGTSRRLGFKRISDYQCDGTLLHILITCRAASSGLKLLQERMLDVVKVPSLVMEGDIIDTSLFNPTEAMRQAEAFEETMDHYRKIRKETGMAW